MPYTCGDLLILNDDLLFCRSIYIEHIKPTNIFLLEKQIKNNNFLELNTRFCVFVEYSSNDTYIVLINSKICHVHPQTISNKDIDVFKKVT